MNQMNRIRRLQRQLIPNSCNAEKLLGFEKRRSVSEAPKCVLIDSTEAAKGSEAADILDQIYRIRHDVYAEELGQHSAHAGAQLKDNLDDFNIYVVAVGPHDGRVQGFVAVTPPMGRPWSEKGTAYSIDKYVRRGELPFEFDDGLYEVRILTMVAGARGTLVAPTLMFAAFRYIEEAGGTRIVVIGRREVAHMYERTGLKPIGFYKSGKPAVIVSGSVTYLVMSALVSEMRAVADQPETSDLLITAAEQSLDWSSFCVPLRAPLRSKSTAPLTLTKMSSAENAYSENDEACFHGGGQAWSRFGVQFSDLRRRRKNVVNADVLDAPFDAAPSVLHALTSHDDHTAWLLRTSPPTHCDGMLRAISQARGVPSECVLPGAGSSSIIFRALPRWLTQESTVLLLDPTYTEYRHVCEEVVGCRVESLTLSTDTLDIQAGDLASSLQSGKYDLVVIVNPNSPTGRFCDGNTLREAIEHRHARTRVWIDEAYIEYIAAASVGNMPHPLDYSLEGYAAVTHGVVVCKTMSKMYALSGARAAYLVGHPDIITPIRKVTPPWAVSLVAQIAAVRALEPSATAYYVDQWKAVISERLVLERELVALGLEVLPGCANFVLVRFPKSGVSGSSIIERCAEAGVFLRNAGRMWERSGIDAVRIAVKRPRENAQILTAIRRSLQ